MVRLADRLGSALVVVGVCGLSARPAAAGEYTHDGFYLRGGIGVGAGWLRAESRDPETSTTLPLRADGVVGSALLLVGGTLRSGVVLGGGALAQSMVSPSGRMRGYEFDDDSEFSVDTLAVVFFADYYLDKASGFHLLGTGGIRQVNLGSPNFRYQVSMDGFSLGVGTGYDFWAGPQLAIGPLLMVRYTAFLPGSGTEGGSLFTGSLALAVTYH
jgi:hypothetical protein